MNLGDLDLLAAVSEGREFELRHPGTGAGLGVFLTCQGYDSEAVEHASREASRKAMQARKADAGEFTRKRRVAMACAALLDVRGGSGGSETAEGLRKQIAEPGLIWIIEQIEEFAGDRASFFPSAETP